MKTYEELLAETRNQAAMIDKLKRELTKALNAAIKTTQPK